MLEVLLFIFLKMENKECIQTTPTFLFFIYFKMKLKIKFETKNLINEK